jgi:hypothetical protein
MLFLRRWEKFGSAGIAKGLFPQGLSTFNLLEKNGWDADLTIQFPGSFGRLLLLAITDHLPGQCQKG